MPIEVMGPPGTMASAAVQAPTGSQAAVLWLRVHNVNYEHKASIRLNGGTWIQLTNSTCDVEDPAKSFGGIGGAFSSIDLAVPVTGGVDGTNTIDFRFDNIAFDSSGYRVLRVDLRSASGSSLLASGQFTDDDPATWVPPLPGAADIAAGDALWSGATLVSKPGGSSILARCSDCHASDGYDLKYFNYSNHSIIQRSKFHGLNDTQGRQIASYIRSLSVPNPGRPWNPPFQPGPGLDAKPAVAWAAGAGLDQAMIDEGTSSAQMPGGGTVPGALADAYTDTVSVRTVNRRQLAISLQFPDWNRWLPHIHPMDVLGSRTLWEASDLYTLFHTIQGRLGGTAAYGFGIRSKEQYRLHHQGLSLDIATWNKGFAQSPFSDASGPFDKGPDNTASFDEAKAQYSLRAAFIVKLWELHQEFDLYGLLRQHYGQMAEPRMMLSYRNLFNLSPLVSISSTFFNLHGDASAMPTNQALASQWYELQITVNGGGRNNPNGGFGTIDWGYMSGIFNGELRMANLPSPTRATLFALKAIQEHDNGYAPDGPGRSGGEQNPWWAFNWRDNVASMDSAALLKMSNDIKAKGLLPMTEDLRRIWLQQVGRYTESQWNNGLYWGGGGTYGTSARTYLLGTNGNPELEAPDRLLSEIRDLRRNLPMMSHAIINAHAEIGRWLWPGPAGANDATWVAERRIDATKTKPASLIATAGPSSVALSWSPVAGALSYNVKRLEGSPSRAITVQCMVPGTSWSDTQRQERTPASYVVSANFANPVVGQGHLEGPDSAAASAAPLAGLVSRWRFDEASGDFIDSGPAGNHAVGIGGTLRTAGRSGSALSPDPSDAVHRYASTKRSFHEPLGGTMTWTAWFRTTATPAGGSTTRLPAMAGAVSGGLPQQEDALVLGQLQADGRIGVMVGRTSTPLTTPTTVNNGAWRHIAVVRDPASGLVRIHLDGAQVASAAMKTGPMYTRCNSLGRVDGTRSIFPGDIDDMRIYDRMLSAAEISAIHAAGASDGSGTASADLLVLDGGIPVADGSSKTIAGSAAGIPTTQSFTLCNLGSANLVFTPGPTMVDLVNCTGSASAPGTPGIVPGGSGNLSFTVTPTTGGAWSARIAVPSNDAGTAVHDILISGTASAAPTPNLVMSQGGTAISDGGSRSMPASTAGTAISGSFDLLNQGTATLSCVPSVGILDLVNCTATASAPSAVIAPGSSGSMPYVITPTSPGPWSVRLTLASNDPDTPTYDVTVSGTATAPATTPPGGSAGGAASGGGGGGGGCGLGLGSAAILAFLAGLTRRSRTRRHAHALPTRPD